LSAERLPRTVAVLEEGLAEGLHLGAQVYVSCGGEEVAELAIGEAQPGVPMRPESLVWWFSATKPVVAVATARLWEQGRLDLDDRIADHIPEFGQRGKERVTVRQVLTHTGGFRSMVDLGWKPEPWEQIVARVCASRLEPDWIPGRKAGYHAVSGWFVLGELIRRLSGRPFADYARDEIFLPLGMADSWIGMPPARYRAYGEQVCAVANTAVRELRVQAPRELEQLATLPNPGAGGQGPIRELGRFYRMLLGRGQLGGRRLLAPQTVEALVARHRVGMFDETFKHVIDWGLGFLIDSNLYGADTVPYGYGRDCSPRTFGHSGRQSSIAFADPERGLVVAVGLNGLPGERRHHRRLQALTAALYGDLGFAA
jgi:CubicO group peptidase (beta-lactamase class C family)